jgi:class 3 adenylate cyclase
VGDDVNIAARVESAGTPMAVTISPATHSMIGNRFHTSSAGIANLKGKGEMELFKVKGRAY